MALTAKGKASVTLTLSLRRQCSLGVKIQIRLFKLIFSSSLDASLSAAPSVTAQCPTDGETAKGPPLIC